MGGWGPVVAQPMSRGWVAGSIETKAISASNLKLKSKLTEAELGNNVLFSLHACKKIRIEESYITPCEPSPPIYSSIQKTINPMVSSPLPGKSLYHRP